MIWGFTDYMALRHAAGSDPTDQTSVGHQVPGRKKGVMVKGSGDCGMGVLGYEAHDGESNGRGSGNYLEPGVLRGC